MGLLPAFQKPQQLYHTLHPEYQEPPHHRHLPYSILHWLLHCPMHAHLLITLKLTPQKWMSQVFKKELSFTSQKNHQSYLSTTTCLSKGPNTTFMSQIPRTCQHSRAQSLQGYPYNSKVHISCTMLNSQEGRCYFILIQSRLQHQNNFNMWISNPPAPTQSGASSSHRHIGGYRSNPKI